MDNGQGNGWYKWLKITALVVTLIITVSSVTANIVMRQRFDQLQDRANENKDNIAELRKYYEDTRNDISKLREMLGRMEVNQENMNKALDRIDNKIEKMK